VQGTKEHRPGSTDQNGIQNNLEEIQDPALYEKHELKFIKGIKPLRK